MPLVVGVPLVVVEELGGVEEPLAVEVLAGCGPPAHADSVNPAARTPMIFNALVCKGRPFRESKLPLGRGRFG